MKQNKDREELTKLLEKLEIKEFIYKKEEYKISVRQTTDLEPLFTWIETHTQKKVEEERKKYIKIIKNGYDEDIGTYDYKYIACQFIMFVDKLSLNKGDK